MAMSDYGVIAKKDGQIVTSEFFTPMKETLGLSFKETPEGEPIEGEYFIYLGDADFYVAIYKGILTIFNQNQKLTRIFELEANPFLPYKTYRYQTTVQGIYLDLKRLDEGLRYYLRFWYRNHCYEAIYGYGIDQNLANCYDQNPKFNRRIKRFVESA